MNLNFFTPNLHRRKARCCMWIMAAGMTLVSCLYIVYGIIGAKNYGMQSGWGYRLESLSDVGHSVSDYEPVWQGNAYVLRGKNPFLLMKGMSDFDPEIGPIVKGTTNVPWTYGLSNILIPGFLPYRIAIVISLLWWVVLWGLAGLLLWYRMKDLGIHDSLFSGMLVLTMFCQCSIGVSLETMNPSLLVVPILMILSFLNDKRYPYLVGCCLALAMIKPQLGTLFFIPFIVKGNFKAVLTGGGLVLLSLLAVSIRVGENPIILVEDAFADGFQIFASFSGEMREVVLASQGIVNALFQGLPMESSTLWHWVFFIPYTFLLCWRFRKSPFYILFSIPFVISMLWMYNLPLGRNTGLLWMALMIMLYRQKTPNNLHAIVAYVAMFIVGFPLMSGMMARSMGTFKIWPMTAVFIFFVLHIVLYWYSRREKGEEPALKSKVM